MKPRHIAVIVAVGLAALAVWWFMQPASDTLKKRADAPSHSSNSTPHALPPAPSGPTIVTLGPPKPKQPPVAAELRGDLKTAVPELSRVLEAHDFTGFVQEFMPPDALKNMEADITRESIAQHLTDKTLQDPAMAQRISMILAVLQTIQDKTPTMKANGDEATFPLDTPVEGQNSITFVKVDGVWYLKSFWFFQLNYK